jgi:integrase
VHRGHSPEADRTETLTLRTERDHRPADVNNASGLPLTLGGSIAACGLHARFAAAIWLILATGVRVGELLGAVWSGTSESTLKLRVAAERSGVKLGFIDLKRRTWHLPETKNQRDHTIHLSAFAIEQCRRLAAVSDAESANANSAVPWVFPNIAGDGPVGVKSFGKQLSDRQRQPDRRLAHRTKDTTSLLLSRGRWTAHDLRRTAATRMAEIGISGDVIDECLNHMIESRVRRTYIHDRRASEQQKAFDALGVQLRAIVNGRAPSSEYGTRRRHQKTSSTSNRTGKKTVSMSGRKPRAT